MSPGTRALAADPLGLEAMPMHDDHCYSLSLVLMLMCICNMKLTAGNLSIHILNIIASLALCGKKQQKTVNSNNLKLII